MKAIYKYPVMSFLQIPEGAEIIHVGHQKSIPVIWAIVNTTAPLERREFAIIATGQEIPQGAIHIGTYQDPPLVWHVFEIKKT